MRAIDADALLDEVMERHCKECDKRKGIKNGKYRIIYEIGDAPCRVCDVDDVKDELEDAPTIEPEPQIIHCNKCKHYQGVHKVQGHAPCNYWGTGAVLWNEYCSKAEPYREGE